MGGVGRASVAPPAAIACVAPYNMHIAIDARLADYSPGGIAQYTFQLSRALRDLSPGPQLTLLRAARPKVAAEPIQGLPIRRLLTPPHHRFEQVGLALELALLRVDLIHSTDFIPPLWRPCPAVITVHDLGFLRLPETLTLASRRHYGQIRRAVQSADAIIAVSQATRQDLIDLVGADPARVTVVLEAAAPSFQPVADEQALRAVRERLGVTRPFVLFVGSIEPRKNLVRLLEAFALVRRELDLELVLLGRPGWLYQPIFRRLAELELEPFVRIVADLPHAELPPVYSAASVLAFPSLYEGFGLPALEALACGCPVVTSDVSSLPEVVGDAAVLVSPTDVDALAHALMSVVSDPSLRSSLSSRGLAHAARFSWRTAAEETMVVYRRALR